MLLGLHVFLSFAGCGAGMLLHDCGLGSPTAAASPALFHDMDDLSVNDVAIRGKVSVKWTRKLGVRRLSNNSGLDRRRRARGNEMNKLLSMLFLFLLQLPLLAAAQERDVANAPVETVSIAVVIAFGVIFLGMIVGFFIYLFMKKEEPQQK
jgi:uncharacterized membrane protein (DUF485 family)